MTPRNLELTIFGLAQLKEVSTVGILATHLSKSAPQLSYFLHIVERGKQPRGQTVFLRASPVEVESYYSKPT